MYNKHTRTTFTYTIQDSTQHQRRQRREPVGSPATDRNTIQTKTFSLEKTLSVKGHHHHLPPLSPSSHHHPPTDSSQRRRWRPGRDTCRRCPLTRNRTKFTVTTNLWLRAEIREEVALFVPTSLKTLEQLLGGTLSDDNFLVNREVDDEIWAAPQSAHCVEYEYHLHRDAVRLCRERGYGIQATLRSRMQKT